MDANVSAPLLHRLAAGAIDETPKIVALGAALGYVISLGTPSLAYGFAALAVFAAAACFVNVVVLPARYGWSLGCLAAGIRLVPTDRARERGIGFVSAFVRAWVMGGLSWIFFLGYVWYWIDSRHRMWHDLAAATMAVKAGAAPEAPFVPKSVARPIASTVGGAFGYLTKLPLVLVVLAQAFFLVVAPQLAAPKLDYVHGTALPADFPSEIVIPDQDHVTDVAVAAYGQGMRRTVVTWQNLEGDPVSALLVWKLGFEVLGFKTDVQYTDTGSHVVFSRDGSSPIAGSVAALPGDDGKGIKTMTLEVDYRGSSASTAATSTPTAP